MGLVATESHGVPPGLGVGPHCLAGAEVRGQGAHDVPLGFRPRDWGNLTGRPVILLFFQLVYVVLDVVGKGYLQGRRRG